MTTLLLRLAGPLQAWGTSSRFNRRGTDVVPSKSGVVGLLAAAEGRRRTESIEHLLGLSFAVRTEQPGTLERDFQTATRRGEETPVSVSTRHYLSDAVFLAAIDGDESLLVALQQALSRPKFPLFLGRRSCPPVGRLDQGLRQLSAVEALQAEPWHASIWFQRSVREPRAALDLVADCDPTDPEGELVHDEPVEGGFDPRHRQWAWRSVRRHPPVHVLNPQYQDHHDPLGVL